MQTASEPPSIPQNDPTSSCSASAASSSSPHPTSSTNSTHERLSPTKRQRIKQAIEEHDIEQLRALAAEPGGFEDSETRRTVWPLILGCDRKGKGKAVEVEETYRSPTEQLATLTPRDDERQVRLDIDRSLVNYPDEVKDEHRDALRTRLETAILIVLRRHPALQYFQGYHDIVSVLLLTLRNDDLVIQTAERLSLHCVRDSMGSGLEPTLGYLKLVHRLVQRVDPEVSGIINLAASMPFFALSWALTLLSHDVESIPVISRVFDFLLGHNPAMIVYFVVAIILAKKDDLLIVASGLGDEDPALVHSALSQLPNIVLERSPTTPSSPSLPGTPTSHNPSFPMSQHSETDYTDEDLMSSASYAASSTSPSDIALSPSLTATTSTSDLSDSLVSISQIPPSPSSSGGLRKRRQMRQFSLSDSFDDDFSTQALEDSMLCDPDCDVGLASSSSLRPSRSSQTPSPTRQEAEILRSEALASPSLIPPPRTVLADDLITLALSLWSSHPLVASPTATPEEAEKALAADQVLGPLSCVFTYDRSERGELWHEEAERIVADGVDIVRPGASAPDPPPAGEQGGGGGGGEADEDYELVDPPSSSSASPHAPRRRNPARLSGGPPGRLNLGPHGWLVLAGGAAVATAAVAYGVYRQEGGTSPGVCNGLGTAGVGLGAGGGGLGAPGGQQPQVQVQLGTTSGMGGLAARMAEGRDL